MSVLLTRRAVVQAAVESSYNVQASVGNNDGVLVSAPTYTADADVLERDFVRDSLSVQPIIIGRMLAKMEFTTELRSNGKTNVGNLSNSPLIARLFQACGYALTAYAASSNTPVYQLGDHVNPVVWTTGGTLTNTDMIGYTI